MSESFSVSIESSVRLYWAKPPGGRYLWGASFCPLGCPFFSLVWAKKRSKRNSTATGWTHASSVLCPPPPSLRSVVRSHGCATLCFEVAHPCSLYRWTLGWRSPTEQGLSQHPPESSLRGAFFCGRKPPIPPKKPLRISPQLITLW